VKLEVAEACERTTRPGRCGLGRHLPLAAVLLVLAAWACVADGGLVRHRALAGPIATLGAIATGLADGTLAWDLFATLTRMIAGVAIGAILGVPLGLVSGGARTRAIEPCLDLLRAIPPLLLFPLLLLTFGYDERARIGAVGWTATLVMSMHVAVGVSRASSARRRALSAMGAGLVHRLRWLHLYELAPSCLTGLRHAVGSGLIVATVTEMVVGAEHGLGSRAVAAQIAYDAAGLYAVILATGAASFALSRIVLAVERRVVRWRA
jgi:NitT/TauT family transport system permease protein